MYLAVLRLGCPSLDHKHIQQAGRIWCQVLSRCPGAACRTTPQGGCSAENNCRFASKATMALTEQDHCRLLCPPKITEELRAKPNAGTKTSLRKAAYRSESSKSSQRALPIKLPKQPNRFLIQHTQQAEYERKSASAATQARKHKTSLASPGMSATLWPISTHHLQADNAVRSTSASRRRRTQPHV